jgi:hypothetical protein
MYAVNEEALDLWGAVAPKNKTNIYIYIYICACVDDGITYFTSNYFNI